MPWRLTRDLSSVVSRTELAARGSSKPQEFLYFPSRKDASREALKSHVPSRTKFLPGKCRTGYGTSTCQRRGHNFFPAKTEGSMIWLPVKDARRAWFFCLGIISLPADDAMRAWFLLRRTTFSELDPTSEIPLGVSLRALSRAPSVCLGARNHRREARNSTSPPHKK